MRIAGLFAGESMFSDATDASKVALVSLVDWLVESGATLLDVQWTTPHLASVGADRRAAIASTSSCSPEAVDDRLSQSMDGAAVPVSFLTGTGDPTAVPRVRRRP